MTQLRLVSWNVNSVRLRCELIARYMALLDADVIALQETKARVEDFPQEFFAERGYPYQCLAGIKGYNGVALLSRRPLEQCRQHDWCARQDARHVSACLSVAGHRLLLHNVYIPAGGDVPDTDTNPKFAHKLAFIEAFGSYVAECLSAHPFSLVLGDLNIAPLPSDVWSHRALRHVVSHTAIEVEALAGMQQKGNWCDAVRQQHPPPAPVYTWWSYRAADFRASNRGRRLDHIWLSQDARAFLSDATVYADARGENQPSDHVPVRVTLSFDGC